MFLPFTYVSATTTVEARRTWIMRWVLPRRGEVRIDVQVERGDDVDVGLTSEKGLATFERTGLLSQVERIDVFSRRGTRGFTAHGCLEAGTYGLLVSNRTWGVLSNGASIVRALVEGEGASEAPAPASAPPNPWGIDHYPDPNPGADPRSDPYATKPSYQERYVEAWPSREEAQELVVLLQWRMRAAVRLAAAEAYDDPMLSSRFTRATPRIMRIAMDYVRTFRSKPFVLREQEMGDVRMLICEYLEADELAIRTWDGDRMTPVGPGFSDWIRAAYEDMLVTVTPVVFPRRDLLKSLHVLLRDGAREHRRR